MIVFLNPWDRFMGPNRYLFEILRHADDLKERSLVAMPGDGETAEEYRSIGCSTEIWPEVTLLRTSPSPANILRLAQTHSLGLARLRSHLEHASPSVVVTNTENLWIGGIASRLIGVPHGQIFHALGFENRLGRRRPLLRAYLRFISSWSRRMIAVSEAVASGLERGGAGPGKIVSIPNPIPVTDLELADHRVPGDIENLLEGRSPIFLSVGHLSPMKGQDLLVEALGSLVASHPRLLCLFAGGLGAATGIDDTLAFEERLHSRIEALGLKDHTCFLGDTDSVPSLLHRADLYVQPSRTESFGRVVAEALVCRTPVVAFDVGGIPEVAGPGALLAPAGDADALASRIVEALTSVSETSERTAKGREWVVSRFDADAVAPRFAALVSTLEEDGRG